MTYEWIRSANLLFSPSYITAGGVSPCNQEKFMNTTTTASSSSATPTFSAAEDSRCAYRFPNGRRCRLPHSAAHSGFCFRHFHLSALVPQTPNDSTDLSADLLPGGLSEFSSAGDIRQFLARLLAQVTKGRISPRRAAVLAFITNQLLHSHRAIHKEADTQKNAESEPPRIIIDMPRPDRD
jgi:hypothetical protein